MQTKYANSSVPSTVHPIIELEQHMSWGRLNKLNKIKKRDRKKSTLTMAQKPRTKYLPVRSTSYSLRVPPSIPSWLIPSPADINVPAPTKGSVIKVGSEVWRLMFTEIQCFCTLVTPKYTTFWDLSFKKKKQKKERKEEEKIKDQNQYSPTHL